MAPIGKVILSAKGHHLKVENSRYSKKSKYEELKGESMDDRGFTEELEIKVEDSDYNLEETPSYSPMNDDEGVVLKREDCDDSLVGDDKIEEDNLEEVEVGSKSDKDQVKCIQDASKALLCKVCGKQFFRAHYYNLHIKTHRTPISNNHHSDKPHKCQDCGKTFALLQHLTGHSRTHIAGQYFECPVCRRKFTELSNLTMHLLKTHPDEKPYKCSECDKQFTQSSALKKHLRSHYNSTSQEELDRIDMMFYVNNETDKDAEEPPKKKIKLEKEDNTISPPKEKVTTCRGKLSAQKEEKSPALKDLTALTKVKPSPQPKSSGMEKPCQQKAKIQPDAFVKDEPPAKKIKEIRVPKETLVVKPSSVSSSPKDAPVCIKDEPTSDSSISEEGPDSPASQMEEPVALNVLANIASVEAGYATPSLENKQLPLTVKGHCGKESLNVPLQFRNAVPLDQVQNPLIKITKYAKVVSDCEPLPLKGQTILTPPLKSVSGSNENIVESHEEETENSNHSTICNSDRPLKGKAMPFVAVSSNKSNLFTSWNQYKPENRAVVPSLEKPDGEYEVRYKCHRCNIFLDTEEKLHDHLMDHTGVKLCECRFCGKNFTKVTSLKRHVYHHIVGSISQDCTKCDKSFSTFRDLKDHFVANKCDPPDNASKLKCFRCRKHMPSLSRLKMHLLSQCSDEPVKYYLPKRDYSEVKETNIDSDSSKLTSKNEWVTQKFEKTSAMDVEDLNLEDEDAEALQVLSELGSAGKGRECWNLQCQGCGYKFENTEKAKVHAQLGCVSKSEEKRKSDSETFKIKVVFEENENFQCSLLCSQCDKKIEGVEKMLLHIKEHIHEQDNMTCPVLKCEKRFSGPKDFKMHLKAHTGHKPYKCSDCGKRFFLRENYENHAQRHGVLKNWSSLTAAWGEKWGKVSASAKSPITIESSIINLEVGEADVDKKLKATAHHTNQTALNLSSFPEPTSKKEVVVKRRKEEPVLQSFNAKPRAGPTVVKSSSSVIAKPAPPASSPPPDAIRPNKPSPFLGRHLPVIINRAASVLNRPQSVFNRPPSVLNRPPSVLNRPPQVINRPSPVVNPAPATMNGTPPFHRPAPLLNRMSHASGGSFSVTPQGIFAVGPARTFPAALPGPSKTLYPLSSKANVSLSGKAIVPREAAVRGYPPSYYRLSEQSARSIEASKAALRKYPRSGRCEVCKKLCSRLDKHMMVHLNQKPHLCPVCPQAFRQSEHLRRHIRARHEGNHRQFECPQCYKRLTRKDKLKEHMKNCCRTPEATIVHTYEDTLFEIVPGQSELPLEGHTTP